MRVFSISPGGVVESSGLTTQLPEQGHVWIACTRQELHEHLASFHAALQTLCGLQLVDLHV